MSDLPEWALKNAESALSDLADESPDYFELQDRIAAALVKAEARGRDNAGKICEECHLQDPDDRLDWIVCGQCWNKGIIKARTLARAEGIEDAASTLVNRCASFDELAAIATDPLYVERKRHDRDVLAAAVNEIRALKEPK